MNHRAAALVATLLLPTFASAEIYSPPDNVVDPARKAKGRSSDASLPYVYLEPHDHCYDAAGPLKVTISAVNRSGGNLTIDWPAVVESLVIDSAGPGRVRVAPVRNKPAPALAALRSFAQITIDLRDWFQIEGPGVYELSYARPLADGRVHVGIPARFVIEDDAAVDKIAAALDPGPARGTLAALLKDTPCFSGGGGAKTYGWDRIQWGDRPEMIENKGDKAAAAAAENWRKGIERLTGKDRPAGSERAFEAIIDRLLFLSDHFRADPGPNFAADMDARIMALPPKDAERIQLKLIRSHSRPLVTWAINRLMSLRSEAALGDLFRIGDGPDRKLAEEAIGSLSSYGRSPRIAAYLRRKMAGDDQFLALQAAIVSCYSGDDSGGPVVVRCMTSDDPKVRLDAIAQAVDERHFRPHREAIVRNLLGELEKPTSSAHLERAIESLGSYPTDEVLKAVTPFQKHADPQVSQRAQMTVSAIVREKGR